MPMDDDRGRGRTSAGYQGQGRGSGVTDARPSPGGGNTGGGDNRDRGGGAAKEAADQKAREDAATKSGEERRAKDAQRAADDARAKATQDAANKSAADKAVKDAADREAASQKARAEAATKETARVAKEAADRESASQKARLDAAVKETARVAKEAADREKAQQQARLDTSKRVTTETMVDKATGKIITVESKGDPNAKNPNSSAEGLGQFTNDTWVSMISKYRPDLMVGRTEAEVLGLRTDPALSVEMTKNYTRENAEGLAKAGFPVNESTLYLSHFLGLGGAKKMLNAPADALASEVAGGDATTRNQSILGGTKTAADVLSWASKKMGGAASYDVAGVTSTTPTSTTSTSPTSTTSTSPTRGITVDAGGKKADLPAAEGTPVEANIGVGGFGRLPPAPEPTSWYDKLVSVFDSTPQIEALEDQNRLAGGLTKQEYADQFAGGDSTKVQSRIVDYGQGQQVDYYTKSLGDKFGEAASNLGKGFSDAGKGVTSLLGFPASETSTAMQPLTTDPFAPTGLGPGGDLTRDQYRDQYGGSDIATNLPPTGTSTTPKTPVVPPVIPTEPVMPTVPNFASAQQYIGTPTVATPGFNFSMPFAPRPPIDFANLGQAYAPTALASAPPPQALPGIPGAMYSTPYQRLG